MESLTHDSISLRGAGIVTVAQHKKGFRFTQDSLLLADFCRIKPRDRVLEPGTGSGIVSLLLAKKFPCCRITAIEIQPSPAALCRRNIEENGLSTQIDLLEQDLRSVALKASTFDAVVANPPYTVSGTGLQSPAHGRQSSRHDRLGDLDAWLGLQRFLKNRGRYVLVFSADRLTDLLTALRKHGLEPKHLRMVHPKAGAPASLALVESVKAAGPGLRVLPPLIVHEKTGGYTREMNEIYSLR